MLGSHRVVIVDDRPEIRLLVRARLGLLPDIEVVGEASNGSEALVLVAALTPDAVVLDLEMPVMRGNEAIPRMRELAPGVRILLYTSADQRMIDQFADDEQPDKIVHKGAPMSSLCDELRLLLEMRPYDVLRVVLGAIPVDQAVSVFDTWVGLNIRILESLAQGDDLVLDRLGGATLEDLQALIGVYAHLGDNLQKAIREGGDEVIPIIHLLRTTAAGARRALVVFDDVHLEDFISAWDYEVSDAALVALREMRDRLLEMLPKSSADGTDAVELPGVTAPPDAPTEGAGGDDREEAAADRAAAAQDREVAAIDRAAAAADRAATDDAGA